MRPFTVIRISELMISLVPAAPICFPLLACATSHNDSGKPQVQTQKSVTYWTHVLFVCKKAFINCFLHKKSKIYFNSHHLVFKWMHLFPWLAIKWKYLIKMQALHVQLLKEIQIFYTGRFTAIWDKYLYLLNKDFTIGFFFNTSTGKILLILVPQVLNCLRYSQLLHMLHGQIYLGSNQYVPCILSILELFLLHAQLIHWTTASCKKLYSPG